jgi:hypothetical protein
MRPAMAQDLIQQVSGIVVERISGNPIAGVAIEIKSGTTVVAGTASDNNGSFELSVAPGRYLIHVTHIGFQPLMDELLVIAGKQARVRFELTEQVTQLKEVQVAASPAFNPSPGATDISIEKTIRVPANFFDPLRMASSMPGMATVNDQGNALAIKGYSPNSILWKVEGLDVINPNHLANAGTLSDRPVSFGGGVSILSSQVIDKTGFYAGSIPAQYGNVLSGVVDMSLREGNKSKNEYTAQASLIGIDLAAEGPLGANGKSSYLANYRYSTVGLLSKLGVNFGDEQINFQDLTFHLDIDQKKSASLSVFGFGGLSSNRFNAKPEADWKEEKDRYTIRFDGKVYGFGFRQTGGDKWKWMIGSALSGQEQDRSSQSVPVPYQHIISESYLGQQYMISSRANVKRTIGHHLLEAGLVSNYVHDNLQVTTVTPLYVNSFFPNVKGTVSGFLNQPYFDWQSTFARGWKTDVSLRYMQFSFNNTGSFEPRATIQKSIGAATISGSYNKTSQRQQTQTYLADNNRSLELTKAHQFLLEYRQRLSSQSKLVVAIYSHHLFDVPTTSAGPIYSTLNQWEDFAPTDLVSLGKGHNRGIELSFDRSFDNKFYFAINGSVYKSTYSNPSSGQLDSRFNGGFTSSTMIGKEWGTSSHSFGIHTRFIYVGGMRQPSVSLFDSISYGTTVYANYLYTVQFPDYWRPDVRLSWRKNKVNYTRTFSIDIQNIANRQNVAYYYFDSHTRDVEVKRQLGIIPVLVYRVDF